MSDAESLFLTLSEVLEIHADHSCLFGGSDGIRDQGALESAIAMPEATFAGAFLRETRWDMAAAYAFHIAQNQPVLDGNRRVGLNACLLFLALNGGEINDPAGALYDVMIAFAEGTLEKPEPFREVDRSEQLDDSRLASPSDVLLERLVRVAFSVRWPPTLRASSSSPSSMARFVAMCEDLHMTLPRVSAG